jgi:hypothetical protein
MHYLDKLPRRRLGAGKTVWVRIKSANQPKVGQNSPGVDNQTAFSYYASVTYGDPAWDPGPMLIHNHDPFAIYVE